MLTCMWGSGLEFRFLIKKILHYSSFFFLLNYCWGFVVYTTPIIIWSVNGQLLIAKEFLIFLFLRTLGFVYCCHVPVTLTCKTIYHFPFAI